MHQRRIWLLGWILLCILITNGCVKSVQVSHVQDQSVLQGEGEKRQGTWKTFVLTSSNQFRPSPPSHNSSTSRDQLDEVIAKQRHITPGWKDRIAYWDEGLITHRWTEILLQKVVQNNLSPVRVSRAIALLNVAMYDAIVASWDAKYAYNQPSPAHTSTSVEPLVMVPFIPSYPSEHATAAEAAATVLSYLFPGDADKFHQIAQEAGESRIYAGANFPEDIKAGQTLGAQVGNLVVRHGQTDGSDQMYAINIPPGPGYWTPPPAGVLLDPMAGFWRPWILADGGDVHLPVPPSPGSPEYQADITAVVATAQHLTDEQKAIAVRWADGLGTVTPAGHWIRIAEEHVSRAFAHDPPRAARAFALVSISMADAFITCWKVKYTYWTARPYQVIPGFKPYIKTPPFPSYPSGHSTQSGAASEVLAYLFPQNAAMFRTMAEEAAISRLYGGIHFPSDNNNGLLIGRQIGNRVVEYASYDRADD
jgi:membrane-associated phospholipid phosphatase